MISSMSLVAVIPTCSRPHSAPASWPAFSGEWTYRPTRSMSGCSMTSRSAFVPMLPVAHWTTRYRSRENVTIAIVERSYTGSKEHCMPRPPTPPIHLRSARLLDVDKGELLEPGELLVDD